MSRSRELFKLAFLEACAHEGLTMEETHEQVKTAIAEAEEAQEKEAIPVISNLLSLGEHAGKKTMDFLGRALGTGVKIMGGGLLVAPVIAGSGAGYLMGKSRGITDEDVEEEKKRELTQAYRDAARRLSQSDQAREVREQRRSRPTRPLL